MPTLTHTHTNHPLFSPLHTCSCRSAHPRFLESAPYNFRTNTTSGKALYGIGIRSRVEEGEAVKQLKCREKKGQRTPAKILMLE